jgi:hypothetical protein
MVPRNPYTGVSFKSLKEFLFYMYFFDEELVEPTDENKALAKKLMSLIVPMQHNINNPLQGDEATDTFIQYWISRDERWTQDFNHRGAGTGANSVGVKLAYVDVRFVGAQAEVWAKAFHHLAKRDKVATYMLEICGGRILEYVEAITPVNIDYFGVGNSTIAFDVSFKIEYTENIDLNWKPLTLIVLGPGDITIEGQNGE